MVILTGAKTYFGRTTEFVQQARPKLHIEAVVARVVRWLFVIVGALLGVVMVLSLVRGVPLLEMLPLMLVLLMSAVPVALPVMFTVSMAVGSKELAKRGVLVTRLSAAEDAATMDVLCVDKTGTLTMNQLTVTGVIPLDLATEAEDPGGRRARLATRPTRIRLTSRSSLRRSGTCSTVSPGSPPSPSALRRQDPAHGGGRRTETGNGCA